MFKWYFLFTVNVPNTAHAHKTNFLHWALFENIENTQTEGVRAHKVGAQPIFWPIFFRKLYENERN